MSATTRRFHNSGDTDDVLGSARADIVTPATSFLARIVRTNDSLGLTVGRLGLGLIMFPHAAQKVLGWFGGHGFAGTYGAFTTQMHIPGPLAFLAIVTEFVASIALIAGAFTRAAAAGIIAVMIGAILTVHLNQGFFMNWYGQKGGEGFEYHLLAISLGLTLVFLGGGKASIDRLLMGRRPAPGGGVPSTFTG